MVIMIFGSNLWANHTSGVEQAKVNKNAVENERKRRGLEKVAQLDNERHTTKYMDLMASRNRSLETMITRDDIEALEMVKEFEGKGMIKELGDARWAIQQQEVRFFLSEYSTAWEELDSQPAGAKGTDLIQLPSHSTEALLSKGFTRKQTKMVQNQITALERSKTTTWDGSYTTMAVKTQQQKEHPALLQRLRNYNDLITKSIPGWEQEELLAEWVDAFWYSDNYEQDMKALTTYIPELDFLWPDEILPTLEEQYHNDHIREQHFNDFILSIIAANHDFKMRYEKLDKRRRTVLHHLLLTDSIEDWYDARQEAIMKAKELNSDCDWSTARKSKRIN